LRRGSAENHATSDRVVYTLFGTTIDNLLLFDDFEKHSPAQTSTGRQVGMSLEYMAVKAVGLITPINN
jgi:hypothetical protein